MIAILSGNLDAVKVMVADPRVDLKTKNDRGQNLEIAAREVCWCHCKRRKALEAFIQQLRRVKKAEEQKALMGEKMIAEESFKSMEEKVKVENEMEKNRKESWEAERNLKLKENEEMERERKFNEMLEAKRKERERREEMAAKKKHFEKKEAKKREKEARTKRGKRQAGD